MAQTTQRQTLPGAGLDSARMPGHRLLARLGKRVLRPGGVELTNWLLDELGIGASDRVVEFAAGLGTTAGLTLARHPASYTGVDRDTAAVQTLSALGNSGRTEIRAHHADAGRTGLADGCATVVYGEAMLTMQPDAGKRRIVREAHRLLASGGRYGIHELCLVPDDIDDRLADEIRAALGESIHVGARPLTVAEWRQVLSNAGFTVLAEKSVPMRLLEPRRLIADEGIPGAARICARALGSPTTLRRIRRMRAIFRRYEKNLAAVGVVAGRAEIPEEMPCQPS